VSFQPQIRIVGDGVAAWLVAAVLVGRLGRGDSIRVVRAGDGGHGLGPFGDGLLALPDWQLTPIAQALPLELLHRHAAANPVLGIAYSGWGPGGAPWFLPFGECGAPIGSVPFAQVAARARLAGRRVRLADYSLAALAAQAERFALPVDDARSPRSALAFAAHLEAGGLAALLKAFATQHGVAEESAPLRAALPGPMGLSGLALQDGRTLTGDLFVDACGKLGGGGDWQSWGELFACDAVTVRAEPERAPAPYALMAASDTGWTATVPVAGRRHVTRLIATGGGALPDGAVRFVPGVAEQPWLGNRVAIGAGALLLEPLFGTALLTATTAAERLAALLPHEPSCRIEAREYNRQSLLEAERLRDLVLAMWRTNGRTGEPLWDVARAGSMPEPLSRKLALYAARGAVPIEDGDLFEEADWALVLDGQGVHPRRVDPVAAAVPPEAIDAHLSRLRERLIAEVRGMPKHADFGPARRV
jgi:tryptophan 7-halogenase